MLPDTKVLAGMEDRFQPGGVDQRHHGREYLQVDRKRHRDGSAHAESDVVVDSLDAAQWSVAGGLPSGNDGDVPAASAGEEVTPRFLQNPGPSTKMALSQKPQTDPTQMEPPWPSAIGDQRG